MALGGVQDAATLRKGGGQTYHIHTLALLLLINYQGQEKCIEGSRIRRSLEKKTLLEIPLSLHMWGTRLDYEG